MSQSRGTFHLKATPQVVRIGIIRDERGDIHAIENTIVLDIKTWHPFDVLSIEYSHVSLVPYLNLSLLFFRGRKSRSHPSSEDGVLQAQIESVS